MPARRDFRPPKDNALLIRLVFLTLPLIMRAQRVVSVQIPDEDWSRLDPLRKTRLILSANHPTGTDPLIAMELARRLGQHFNFVAAVENFDGLRGWIIQRLGAYSIARGLPDRSSLQTTRRLLSVQDRKVALFPEGETYYHNDITLPFQSGVTQLGFWALTDLQKLGKEPVLPIVPVAIKYCFVDDPVPEIHARLAFLEDAVGIAGGSDRREYDRLIALGERVASMVERQYRLPEAAGLELDVRIMRLKEHIIERVAAEIRETPPDGPLPEQMRFLFNALRSYSMEFVEANSGYEQRIHQRRMEHAEPLFADLLRLHDFLALTGHYVRDHPTWERFADVLSRLEQEIFGRARSWTPVEARVRIADPVRLEEWLGSYKENRKAAVGAATKLLEKRVVGLLRQFWDAGNAMPEDGFR